MADKTVRTHKNARNDLTAEYVRSILDYDPETGLLRWKVTLSKRAVAGRLAGWKRHIGHYPTFEEAVAVRKAAEERIHREFTFKS